MMRRILTWLAGVVTGLALAGAWLARRQPLRGRMAADVVEDEAEAVRTGEAEQDEEDAAAVAAAHDAPIETLPEMDPPLAWWRPTEVDE